MDPTNNVTPFYLDKALWVTFLTPILALLGDKFGLKLDPVVVATFVLPVVAYIVMHKWKTATLAAADKAAAAATTAAQKESPAVALAEAPK